MTDSTVVPEQGGATPAETPPVPITPEQIQAMVQAEAQRIVDQRIPGLQSAYEKQIASLRKELKKAQADPDGYVGNDSSELEAQLAQARREADALRAGRQFPDAFPVYESLMAASSAEEQLEILQAFVRGKPPTRAAHAQWRGDDTRTSE
jgi:cell division septum initiation protein DivIVA